MVRAKCKKCSGKDFGKSGEANEGVQLAGMSFGPESVG